MTDRAYRDVIRDTPAIGPNPSSRVAEPAGEPRLDELLGAPPAELRPPRQGGLGKPAMMDRSEVSTLKAKEKRSPDPAKELAAIGSETDVIKSKPCSETEAELLRRKGESHAASAHELDDTTGTGLLREKLAAGRATSDADAKPRLAAGGSSQARLRSKFRALPDLVASEESPNLPGRRPPPDASLECEIRWRPSDSHSRFVAVVPQALNADRPVAASPDLSWHRSDPPPETPDTAEALRALVSRLVRDGWTVEGRGEDWYSIRLSAAAAEATKRSIVGE